MEVPPPTRSLPASGPLLVLFLLPPVATQLIPLLLGEVTSQTSSLSSLSTWHHLTHRQPPTNVGLQAPAHSGDPSVSAPAQGGSGQPGAGAPTREEGFQTSGSSTAAGST